MHRTYENEDIAIFWDSEKCYHAKRCVGSSPKTFDPGRRPWIDPGQADTAEIWQAVSKCPSGALTCVYKHEIRVEFDSDGNRSVALLGEDMIGECDYQEKEDGWEIYHTGVEPEYEGRGIAKRLVFRVVEEAERQKKKVIPVCSYAAKILKAKE